METILRPGLPNSTHSAIELAKPDSFSRTESANELKRQLVGPPMMELRVNGAFDIALAVVSQRVNVLQHGDGWIQYETETPDSTNPLLVKALAEANVDVITLSEKERSLESVYLQAVGGVE